MHVLGTKAELRVIRYHDEPYFTQPSDLKSPELVSIHTPLTAFQLPVTFPETEHSWKSQFLPGVYNAYNGIQPTVVKGEWLREARVHGTAPAKLPKPFDENFDFVQTKFIYQEDRVYVGALVMSRVDRECYVLFGEWLDNQPVRNLLVCACVCVLKKSKKPCVGHPMEVPRAVALAHSGSPRHPV